MMVPSWFLLALVGAVSQAIGLALKKHAIRVSGANGLVAAGIFLGAGVVLFITRSIAFGTPLYAGTIPLQFWGGVVLAVVFGTLGVLFSYRSLDLGDLSAVSPYSVVATVLYFIPAYLFLHEVPTLSEASGMIVIIIGALVLEGKVLRKRKLTKQEHADRTRNRKALGYFFFAMIFYSISPTGEKLAITATEPMFASYVIHLGIGIAFLISLLVRPKYRDLELVRQSFRTRAFVVAIAVAALVAAYGNLSTHFALSDASVGGVMSIKRTMPIFAFFMGYFIFHERKDALRKLIGTVIMISGAILVGLGG
jgi:drug/metabolite transporter (DMT)-like permease